ncbi:hypothetical protein Cantr_05218 [Candida viswanathii]|uniref:Uncharacterized protein n=1 Tax=Candida viswanathii TaxID=5486 RepID=A0A367XQW3_9ASCO|nr:hypothetical protein Cantr_05218 [Candida viswanathii]
MYNCRNNSSILSYVPAFGDVIMMNFNPLTDWKMQRLNKSVSILCNPDLLLLGLTDLPVFNTIEFCEELYSSVLVLEAPVCMLDVNRDPIA